MYSTVRYMPFGDIALLVEFGNAITPEINQRTILMDEVIRAAELKGVEEITTTYRSLLVRYDPSATSYEQLVFKIRDLEKTLEGLSIRRKERSLAVPVCYGGEYGPDLSYVASIHGLTESQVVEVHSERKYMVYMIGFIAGFPYLGKVTDEIATPRLETPRLRVPAGSVGIAENQTGIYPHEAPGGWRIIGRTHLRLFNPYREPPTLVSAGDTVEFKSISEEEFHKSSNG